MVSSVSVVILAAGQGQRMQSATPKVLHPLGGKPLLAHVLETVHRASQSLPQDLSSYDIAVVLSPALAEDGGVQQVLAAFPQVRVCVQATPRGTGDALKVALSSGACCPERVLVLCGDTPLLQAETLQALVQLQHTTQAAAAVLAMQPSNPQGYGRLQIEESGQLCGIVEHKDATEAQRAITLCHAGVLVLDQRACAGLDQLTCQNGAAEYYLTDLIAYAAAAGYPCTFLETDPEEVQGINTRHDLALAEQTLQQRLRMRALQAGVTLRDPSTTYLSLDTQFASDVTLHPHVHCGPGVIFESGVTVFPFSVLENTRLCRGAQVGPFVHLRGHTQIGAGTTIGNFVEIKNATLGSDVRAKHLAYIGDATLEAGVNIGAGAIICNYDGQKKHQTHIGAKAFIGSNASLVAPLSIGPGALIGAGSVITQDVPEGVLALARVRQRHLTRKV